MNEEKCETCREVNTCKLSMINDVSGCWGHSLPLLDKMKIYQVIFSANKTTSDQPEYDQGYQAFYEGEEVAIWNQPGQIRILEKEVLAENGTSAIIKFRQWQNNGKPISWLTE